jgi:epoxyqueuosine reductase
LPDALGQSILPGINGTYDRVTCNMKMEKDIEEAIMAISVGAKERQALRLAIDKFEEDVMVKPKGDNDSCHCVEYCRRCELSCPVGKQGDRVKLF